MRRQLGWLIVAIGLAAGRGAAQDELAALVAERQVVVSQESCAQIFTPYLRGGAKFITSDSLLAAYHRILEESLASLEQANAGALTEWVRQTWTRLPEVEVETGKPELETAARRLATIAIGVAMRLGGEPIELPPDLAEIVDSEAERVEKAQDRALPAWLGNQDGNLREIDYSRFMARGFYTRNALLQRYFRMVSWLQAIPFRVASDEELLAAMTIREAAGENEFDLIYTHLFGRGDDATVRRRHWRRILRYEDLTSQRQAFVQESARYGQVNDQVQLEPRLTVRILPSARLPDAVLFQRLADQGLQPTGMAVAAKLGSVWAGLQVEAPVAAVVAAEPGWEAQENQANRYPGGLLYGGYLQCLMELANEPDMDAPAFMRTDAWQRKSCQTVLAGWAQQRHAWLLQAKQSVQYASGSLPGPAGFVEPDPDFFARFARHVAAVREALSRAGAFEVSWLGVSLRAEAEALDGWPGEETVGKAIQAPNGDALRMIVSRWAEATGFYDIYPMTVGKVREQLLAMAVRVERGEPTLEVPRLKEVYAKETASRWAELEQTAVRLALIAHKQLRGVPLSDADNRHIDRYGFRLAHLMFYEHHAYRHPRDDAPVVADVHTAVSDTPYLHVGVGRPRALYVSYPTADGPVLCIGAVYPYYECWQAARLTDEDWRQFLAADRPPNLPAWAEPLYHGGR